MDNNRFDELTDFNLEDISVFNTYLILNGNLFSEIDWNGVKRPDMRNTPLLVSSHEFFFFCAEGEAVVSESGKTHVLHKGDALMSPSGYISELVSMSDDIKYFYIAISTEFLRTSKSVFNETVLMKKLSSDPVSHIGESEFQECIDIYKRLLDRANRGREGMLYSEIIKGYLQALVMIYFAAKMEDNTTLLGQKFSRQQELYDRFMTELNATRGLERNISYYADKLCVTPRYLSRIIKEVSGQFASDHIDLYVISIAKQLLASKKYTVLQVSEILNFSSQSLFGRFFKNFTGHTPKEYQSMV